MDKHNRISIKINGKESKIKKEEKETPEFVESEKPLIIIENDEVAAAQEEEEDDFSWVLPDENLKNHSSKEKEIPVIPIEDLRQSKGPSKIPYIPRKKKGFHFFPVKQFAVSFVLAVILGIGFGFMILKIVDDVNAGSAENEAPAAVTEDKDNPPPTGKQEEAPVGDQVAIDLETLSTGVVQGGRFSTAENANAVVNEIKGKGFAATAVEMDGAFFVIAGIGSEQGSVAGMKTKYQEPFPEFFAKTFEIPGGSYTNAGKADAEAIKVALPVYKELVALSSQAFGTGAIDNGQWESLTKQIATVKDVKADSLHAQLKEFYSDIQSAFTHLQEFKNGGDQKALWQSQQSLLNAYQAYSVWISELS